MLRNSFDTERVLAVAAAQLDDDPDGGAALCVVVGGEEVVDATFGLADAVTRAPYTQDTLHLAYSKGKGVCGVLVARALDAGQLDLGKRVADYWPEFAAAGKQDVTVSEVLSHRAGLTVLDGGLALTEPVDTDALDAAIAAQAPLWEPGTRHGYSPVVFGNVVDGLLRRATGQGVREGIGQLDAELGLEIYLGLPEEHWHRAARCLSDRNPSVLPPEGAVEALADPTDPFTRVAMSLAEIRTDPEALWNGEGIRRVSLPGTNMHGNARSFAHLYAALLDGRACSADALAAMTAPQAQGTDASTLRDMSYAHAFQLPSGSFPFSPNPRAFGHGGAASSMAFADPETGLAMCWIPTRASAAGYDARLVAVTQAVYDALA